MMRLFPPRRSMPNPALQRRRRMDRLRTSPLSSSTPNPQPRNHNPIARRTRLKKPSPTTPALALPSIARPPRGQDHSRRLLGIRGPFSAPQTSKPVKFRRGVGARQICSARYPPGILGDLLQPNARSRPRLSAWEVPSWSIAAPRYGMVQGQFEREPPLSLASLRSGLRPSKAATGASKRLIRQHLDQLPTEAHHSERVNWLGNAETDRPADRTDQRTKVGAARSREPARGSRRASSSVMGIWARLKYLAPLHILQCAG